jgi:hypothetical protein
MKNEARGFLTKLRMIDGKDDFDWQNPEPAIQPAVEKRFEPYPRSETHPPLHSLIPDD